MEQLQQYLLGRGRHCFRGESGGKEVAGLGLSSQFLGLFSAAVSVLVVSLPAPPPPPSLEPSCLPPFVSELDDGPP